MAALCKLTGHTLPYRCGDCPGYCIEQAGMTTTTLQAELDKSRPPAPTQSKAEPPRRSARLARMTNQKVTRVLAKHDVRTACTIVDLYVLATDLLDVQPLHVLQALIREAERRHRTAPAQRQRLRETLIEYARERLREAEEHERKT